MVTHTDYGDLIIEETEIFLRFQLLIIGIY
jgi:hypothetical protein